MQGHSALAVKGDESGDGDGDAGGLGGLAGALTGMMGGGGADGGDDDDDPNMIGTKKKKKGDGAAAIDTHGLESALASGGIGQLTSMLSAMRAAQGSSDNHIKKGPNGEDMYDFRDLDDGFTTPKPIKMAEPMTMPPMPAVSVPRMPSISLPGKGGKIKGLAAAERDEKAAADSKLVVWPPATPPPPVAQVAPPVMAPMTGLAAGSAPGMVSMTGIAGSGVPGMAPITGVVAGNPAPGMAAFTSPTGLYQGLAAMRQSMEMLMNQAAGMGGGAAVSANGIGAAGNVASLTAKVDQLSQSFAAEEKELEGKVEALQSENTEMKKQLKMQADEIHELTLGEHAGKGAKTAARVKATAYATKPWDATFSVSLDGKAGSREESFTVRVHPEWAPEGAKRFQDMVQDGVLQGARFFRVVPNFMVQFGIPGSPQVAASWRTKRIKDDPVKKSNTRGMMTFATSGPNTRTTQMFINYANNEFLDKQGFAPFAEVLGDGMNVVDRIQSKYKEKPNQGKIQHHGNKYLLKHFPDLSFVGHVDATLTSAPKAAGFLQDSQTSLAEAVDAKHGGQSFRYGGIATFFHRKH
jgi:cyclophilin family peptidyl-prolyl cis-trans isomerase